MYQEADAFVALPGGFGTFEELLETITWAQLGIHSKPVGILNIDGFYDPFLKLVNQSCEQGFIQPKFAQLIVDSDPKRLLEKIFSSPVPQSEVIWLKEDQI